jgi:hypothetical protein
MMELTYDQFVALCIRIAPYLGAQWRADFPPHGDTWPTWSADLCGPHGWQLHLTLASEQRIQVTGYYAGQSLFPLVGDCAGYRISVLLKRSPRALANDFHRRLLLITYPALFALAEQRVHAYALAEARERATIALLLSLDPCARSGSGNEVVIFGRRLQVVCTPSSESVEFERVRVTPAQATLILMMLAPQSTRADSLSAPPDAASVDGLAPECDAGQPG